MKFINIKMSTCNLLVVHNSCLQANRQFLDLGAQTDI